MESREQEDQNEEEQEEVVESEELESTQSEEQSGSEEAESTTPSLERLRQLIRVDKYDGGRDLYLRGGKLTAEMVPLLFHHIRHEDPSIDILHLEGREQLSFSVAFAEQIKTDTCLLMLSFEQFYTKVEDPPGTLIILEALKTNSTLLRLVNSGDSHFGEKSFLALADTLRVNSTLRSVHLSGTTDTNAVALARALESDETSVREITLGSTTIGDVGAAALAAALKSNKTLEELDIIGSNIESEGAVSLSEALKVNSTLRVLHLIGYAGSDFWTTAGTPFGEALKVNRGLSSLKLPCGANWDFANAFETNQTLQELHVYPGELHEFLASDGNQYATPKSDARLADSLNHICGRNRILYHKLLHKAPSPRFLAALLPYWASRLTSSQCGPNDPWLSPGLQDSYVASDVETLAGPRAGLSLLFQYIKDCCEAIVSERTPTTTPRDANDASSE